MMKNLYKTLSKTSNFVNSQPPNHLYPISLPYFSTDFTSNQQPQSNLQSHIDQNNESEDQKIKTLRKPTQILYQSKVANWVNLIGTIQMPIKFLTCADGKAWAATLISQEKKTSSFRMPVIFQDDLAYTAMMHLRENDTVYIAGHLTSEPLPIDLSKNQSYVQILVQDVHFVRGMMNKSDRHPKHSPKSTGNPTVANFSQHETG